MYMAIVLYAPCLALSVGKPAMSLTGRISYALMKCLQELSYGKQIARKLRTQYVKGLNITP